MTGIKWHSVIFVRNIGAVDIERKKEKTQESKQINDVSISHKITHRSFFQQKMPVTLYLYDLNTNLTCFICASKLEISHLK